jgi:hypothetical protein
MHVADPRGCESPSAAIAEIDPCAAIEKRVPLIGGTKLTKVSKSTQDIVAEFGQRRDYLSALRSERCLPEVRS